MLVARRVVHKAGDGEKVIDARKICSSRHYFQCVLAREALWARGVEQFSSGKPSHHYWLLLHNKATGGGDKKRKLAEVGDSTIDMKCLKKSSQLLPGEMHLPDLAGVAGDDGGGDAAEVDSDADSDEVAAAPGSPAPELPAPAGDGGDSPLVVLAPDIGPADPDVAGDEVGAYQIPRGIAGCSVAYEWHRPSNSMGLRIKCDRHSGCRRFHSLARDRFGLGICSAECFLGAWVKLPAMTRLDHKDVEPTREQIEAYRLSVL